MARTILLVDPQPLFREGLRAVLAREPSFEVVGEAADAQTAYELVERTQPDVVVLETLMNGVQGACIARELHRRHEAAAILVLSCARDEQHVLEVLANGAHGFASKEQPIDEIIRAIGAVAVGDSYLDPTVSRCVLERFARLSRRGSAPGPLPELTAREREVFLLTAQGLPAPAIATRLAIRRRTVDSHRMRLMRKLDLHSAADLVRLAARLGFLPTPAMPSSLISAS